MILELKFSLKISWIWCNASHESKVTKTGNNHTKPKWKWKIQKTKITGNTFIKQKHATRRIKIELARVWEFIKPWICGVLKELSFGGEDNQSNISIA